MAAILILVKIWRNLGGKNTEIMVSWLEVWDVTEEIILINGGDIYLHDCYKSSIDEGRLSL